MNNLNLIFSVSLYLFTGTVTHAAENSSAPGEITYEPTDPERVLVLYDNPMEEHTVISVVIAPGYNIKDENELKTAINVLKEKSSRIGAHAVIVSPPAHNNNVKPGIEKDDESKIITGKAIRYKHFYY